MRFRYFLYVVLFAFAPIADSNQADSIKVSKSPPSGATENTFISLRDQRDSLEKEVRDLEQALADLKTQQYWLKEERSAIDELKEKEKDNRASRSELEQLRKKRREARDFAATQNTLDDTNKLLNQKQIELDAKKKRKDEVESEMNRMIDLEKPKQDFKTKISAYFAGLVALVIVGFFVVAGRDENVRREIFSGQSGIQFITLFSLVIAIILFGITGILEGKELSALLGGLSGYILGRSATMATTK